LSCSDDWRSELPETRRRHLRIWLWSGAGLTFLILVIGGITRLTQSGLSIVDWDPIVGVVPPLGHAQWEEAFARYRQFPEYQRLRDGMTLAEFRFIYFWEYLHRLAARTIGLVFLVPFLWFWARGYLNPPLRRRLLLLFGLGAVQGAMGWFVVRSGLVDDPRVSQYRLAAHLAIAVTIFGACIWLVRELTTRPPARPRVGAPASGASRWVYLLGGLLALQIVWGAFVAGLDAGLIHNTFPGMGGGLLPPNGLQLEPALRNLTENPVTVQWIHRLLGTLLLLTASVATLAARDRQVDPTSRRLALAFWTLVATQYGLGVLTLLRNVPLPLGITHQAMALVIVGVWLVWLHHERRLRAIGARPAEVRHVRQLSTR
jgi:cytochrome c oxidase assembly protein subunit 15